MAHHIYTTKAIVISSTPSGEANASCLVFTQELGLVRARAQGVRLQKSKLRFSLQPFSLCTISLVRGKSVWRIVNAAGEGSLYRGLRDESEKIALAARILSLIERLVRGEEKNEMLFLDVSHGLQFLSTEPLVPTDLAAFECALVLKILRRLGYLGAIPELERAVSQPLSRDILEFLAPLRSRAISIINTSLRETQL